MSLQSIYIVSVPRSGSTLLTNMLDAYEDVICPPESFFPAVLDQLEDREMADHRKVAALFVVSCSDGSPLTLEEAETCIRQDKQETLDALAIAIATKLGRDPATLRTVIWKFTRMVGSWRFVSDCGGKFIILHRNLLNVYESQFRVPFGEKNRNPLRFAFFAASYDVAFAAYPNGRVLALDYADMPARMGEILSWIGSAGRKREASVGTLDAISEKNPWHANINKPFDNKDAEKLQNLTLWQSKGFSLGYAILKKLTPLTRQARRLADQRQMRALRHQATELLKKS
ncbi:MAG: sulfotransferase [Luteolibacter sp.]